MKITDYGINGCGITHQGKKTIFVQNAILNEDVNIDNIIQSKNTYHGIATNFNTTSINRIKPICPYFLKCGGCQLQHMNRVEQDLYKMTILDNLLKKFHIDCDVLPIISVNNWGYRNKVNFAIQYKDNKNIIGYNKFNSNEIIPITKCLLDNEFSEKILTITRKFLEHTKLKGMDIITKKGDIRYLVARKLDKRIFICVVCTHSIQKELQIFNQYLIDSHIDYSLMMCVNNNPKTILNDNIIPITNIMPIEISKMGVDIDIDTFSFLQVNDKVADMIYQKILDNIPNECVVINGYSGAGLLTAMIAKKVKYCIGIEVDKNATELANKLMQKNNINNMKNYCAKCEELIPQLLLQKNIINQKVVLVLDPSRSGVNKELLQYINSIKIDKIIYLSCYPPTMCRDLSILMDKYNLQNIQPYDMFPNTSHIEVLSILTKK